MYFDISNRKHKDKPIKSEVYIILSDFNIYLHITKEIHSTNSNPNTILTFLWASKIRSIQNKKIKKTTCNRNQVIFILLIIDIQICSSL
jgi:hypothetical protein